MSSPGLPGSFGLSSPGLPGSFGFSSPGLPGSFGFSSPGLPGSFGFSSPGSFGFSSPGLPGSFGSFGSVGSFGSSGFAGGISQTFLVPISIILSRFSVIVFVSLETSLLFSILTVVSVFPTMPSWITLVLPASRFGFSLIMMS